MMQHQALLQQQKDVSRRQRHRITEQEAAVEQRSRLQAYQSAVLELPEVLLQ